MNKMLNLENYKCTDGAVVKIDKQRAIITYDKGEWPEVEFMFTNDLKEFDCISFQIKVVEFKTVTTIFHNKQGRAISDTAKLTNRREFPNGSWEEVVWCFREQPGWITPPSPKPFDFDNSVSIGFCVDGNEVNQNSYIEIKDLVLYKKANNDEKIVEETNEFNRFIANHRGGCLKNKKVLLWASSKTTSNTPMGWSSIDSVNYMLDTYKKYKNVNGLIMKMDDKRSPIFVDTFFTPGNLDTDIIDRAVKLYKKIDWGNFTDNFFLFTIAGMAARQYMIDGKPTALDWFDDDLFYNHIFPKIAYLCKAIKEMGANICFDNEAYSTEPYDYYYKYKNTGKSFEEYEEKVCQRGKEFADVICSNYPKAKILLLFGPWATGKLRKEEARYGLLPAFFDGLCKADTDLTIIDGYEGGYEFTTHESVLKGLYFSKKCYKDSRYPLEYQKKIKTDFGIWVRPNVMSKESFSNLLVDSLKECNEYVWVYTEDWPIDNEKVFDYIIDAGVKVEEERKKEL